MTSGNFSMILLNIALVLFGISYSERDGSNNNTLETNLNNNTGRGNLDSQNSLLFKDEYNADDFYLNIQDDILQESNNPQVYNLKGPRGGNPSHDHILKERPLKILRGQLYVQRRKLLHMKKKVDEIHKTLSQRLEKFCTLPERGYSFHNFANVDDGANDIYGMSYENNTEYSNVIIYSRQIIKYLNQKKHTKEVYTSAFLPTIQKNIALQRYIKNTIDECLNLIEFIHKKKGKIDNIGEYLKENNTNTSVALYSHDNGSNGIFSSTTAKITFGILGCLLVSGGIAFAFYYKKIMLKN
ncbi:hypothetical protein PRELSG_0004000 [Plasmodium relictum]|uniref:PIR protein n=1 Tax=Plasmodium relictum TaxID=85471 RepID=A0A1J1GND7_PLARL|nr:hypothetical protein PRELSG_0004000 [Plasmodium relictum]CRG85060.1 hypothetical protein PRELSG_0004000 [Plasmodium relictum]